MKKILIVIFLLILAFFLGFFANKFVFTGNAIKEGEYSWTTAICNENKCLDVVIYCLNGEVVKIIPTESEMNVTEGFVDSRNITGYCKNIR